MSFKRARALDADFKQLMIKSSELYGGTSAWCPDAAVGCGCQLPFDVTTRQVHLAH